MTQRRRGAPCGALSYVLRLCCVTSDRAILRPSVMDSERGSALRRLRSIAPYWVIDKNRGGAVVTTGEVMAACIKDRGAAALFGSYDKIATAAPDGPGSAREPCAPAHGDDCTCAAPCANNKIFAAGLKGRAVFFSREKVARSEVSEGEVALREQDAP